MNLAFLTILLVCSTYVVSAASVYKTYTWDDILVRTPSGKVVPVNENDIVALYDAVQVEDIKKPSKLKPKLQQQLKADRSLAI